MNCVHTIFGFLMLPFNLLAQVNEGDTAKEIIIRFDNLSLQIDNIDVWDENGNLKRTQNPTIYQDLMEIYWAYNRVDELLEFLSHQQNNYIDNNTVKGNLYFYTAVIYYDKEDVKNANLNFGKAREQFIKVFEPDHPVFEAIDSYTE